MEHQFHLMFFTLQPPQSESVGVQMMSSFTDAKKDSNLWEEALGGYADQMDSGLQLSQDVKVEISYIIFF